MSSAAGPASSFGGTGAGSWSTPTGQRSRSPERAWSYRVHCEIFDAFTGPRMMTSSRHVYKVRPRKDKRGVDLISDALPFGGLWYGEPNASATQSATQSIAAAHTML